MDLTELAELAERLNRSRDALTEEIKKHELVIAKLSLGVDAAFKTDNGSIFGYGRVDNKWGFFYRKDDQSLRVPIVHASTKVRIEFMQNLRNVIRALTMATNELANETRSATELAEEMMKAIEEVDNGLKRD